MRLAPPASTEGLAILEAFAALSDVHQSAGKRHQIAFCLALFTLAITSRNRDFLAIGDWPKSYRRELIVLLNPSKQRPPSYS